MDQYKYNIKEHFKLATMMIKSHCQNDQKRLKEYDLVNPYREKRETVLRAAIMNSTKVKGPLKISIQD